MKVNLTINVPNWLDRVCAWPVVMWRKWKDGEAYRRIGLTDGKFAVVDEEDYYRLGNFGWCAKTSFGKTYAIRFVDMPKRGAVMVSMHREIINAPAGLLVDHRNTDSLDNRRSNLRLATHSQNMSNRRKMKIKTSSQYIGVSFEKSRGLWITTIRNNNKSIWLGRFKNEIDTARAYDRAAIKYHGEFARLNFSREDYNVEIQTTND
jgi:hypothetical protein